MCPEIAGETLDFVWRQSFMPSPVVVKWIARAQSGYFDGSASSTPFRMKPPLCWPRHLMLARSTELESAGEPGGLGLPIKRDNSYELWPRVRPANLIGYHRFFGKELLTSPRPDDPLGAR